MNNGEESKAYMCRKFHRFQGKYFDGNICRENVRMDNLKKHIKHREDNLFHFSFNYGVSYWHVLILLEKDK